MNILAWYNETKTGGVGSVSKIHLTRDGQTTLCGRRPGRNAVFEPLGNEQCSKCDDIHERIPLEENENATR